MLNMTGHKQHVKRPLSFQLGDYPPTHATYHQPPPEGRQDKQLLQLAAKKHFIYLFLKLIYAACKLKGIEQKYVHFKKIKI